MEIQLNQSPLVGPGEVSRLVGVAAQIFQVINAATLPGHRHKRATKSQEVHFVIDVLKDLADRSYPQNETTL
ncbi:hypothetical protein [Anaerosolibacter sp.]|uniref:hypothetical protein n=1 Tax=Anaerosolibacter sp. TaxID=1872527 RepID=UPI0039F01213